MQAAVPDSHPTIEMSLREHLLAAGAGQPTGPVTPHSQSHPASPQDHHIDPAIAGSGGYSISGGDNSGDGSLGEGRKGRRELSTSKRAAQNRAAQRAFRQRKEEYIKSLKDQVREYESLAETYKAVQAENYQLRDYIINLQSRLLETQGELPPPPANIDLTKPHPSVEQREPLQIGQQNAPTATMTPGAVSQLQQAAAQASAHDISARKHTQDSSGYVPASEYPAKRQKSDNASADVVDEGANTTEADSNTNGS